MPVVIDINLINSSTLGNNDGQGQNTSLKSGPQSFQNVGEQSQLSKLKVSAIAVAAMAGKQALSYATSNVGKWTGNSRNQTMVNNINQAAGVAAMALIHPALAMASVGMNIVTTLVDTKFEQKWDSRRSNQAAARAGYTSSKEIVGEKT